MEEWLWSLAEHFAAPAWIGVLLLLTVAIKYSDFFKGILLSHRKISNDERALLSADNQKLIDNLRLDCDAQRNRRIEDARWYEGEIRKWRNELDDVRSQLTTANIALAELTKANSQLTSTNASQERGNSRMRHALANVLTAYGGLRMRLRKEGRELEPYTGLATLMDLGFKKEDMMGLDGVEAD